MAKPLLQIADIRGAAIVVRPRIVAFNRLEARPRTLDFTRSLRAEVRDPLWFLTRQWQFGEFAGEDAASPVTCRIAHRAEVVDRVAFADGNPFPLPDPLPLEARVERERVPLVVHGERSAALESDVLIATQWGLRFRRALVAAGASVTVLAAYAAKFVVTARHDAKRPDPAAAEFAAVTAARVPDGVKLWRAVLDGSHDTWIDAEGLANAGALKALAADFAADCTARATRMFTAPTSDTDTAWRKEHLEYGFALGTAPSESAQTVIVADQHHGGTLDWHAFDVDATRRLPLDGETPPGAASDVVQGFLPASVKYRGQPQPRFWEMEEATVNFGVIDTTTTGLLHLMLAEFGLIYSNDWFVLPLPLPVNTICTVRGIVVDDTFGRHTFVRPAGGGPETAWQRWAMFHLSERGATRASVSRFFLPPVVGKILESQPLEQVNFLRDEMANMVWAVERIVPSQTGRGMSGDVLEHEKAPLKRLEEDVAIRYDVGSRMPLNWIPFVPVQIEGANGEIRLQRARMAGAQAARGDILRVPRSPYLVEEEEVPRAGVIVERLWQRARWLLGRTYVWVGRRKTAGRGEGWSHLRFDRVEDLPPMAQQD